MAWRQETDLLDLLCKARCTHDFELQQAKLKQLCEKIASTVQQGAPAQLLSDEVFVEKLFTAACNVLATITSAPNPYFFVTIKVSSCIAALLTAVDDLLKSAVSGTQPSAAGPPPSRVLSTTAVTGLQDTLEQTGLITSLAAACQSLSTAVIELLSAKCTDCGRAAVSAAAPAGDDVSSYGHDLHAATISMSQTVLHIWSAVGAVVEAATAQKSRTASGNSSSSATAHSSASAGESQEPLTWLHSQLQQTIEPSFSLINAVLQSEASYSSSSSSSSIHVDSNASRSEPSSSLLNTDNACIWDAVTSASADICYTETQMMLDGRWNAEQSPHVEAFRQLLQSQAVQDLQLIILAAVSGGLHHRQRGVSPIQLSEPASAGGSRQGSRQLVVADCSAELLQKLGLLPQQGHQLYELIASELSSPRPSLHQARRDVLGSSIDTAVHDATMILALAAPVSLLSSKDAGVIPILKVKLAIEVIVLLPNDVTLVGPLTCLLQAGCNWNQHHLLDIRHGRYPETRLAVAAAVADSILAPLLLEVGPVVLGVEDPDGVHVSQWASAMQQFWAFCYIAQGTSDDDAYHAIRQTCANIVQQRPFTVAASLEAAIRTIMSEPAQIADDVRVMMDSITANPLLEMVYMFFGAVASNSDVQAALATAAHNALNNSGSRSNNRRRGDLPWPMFSSKELAAIPFSLLISCLKFIARFDAKINHSEVLKDLRTTSSIDAANAAILVVDAAKQLAAAVTTHSDGSNSSAAGAAAASVPWLHVAARALFCWSAALSSSSSVNTSKQPLESCQAKPSPADLLFLSRYLPHMSEYISWCWRQWLTAVSYHEKMVIQSHDIAPAGAGAGAVYVQGTLPQLLEDATVQLMQQAQELKSLLKNAQQRWSTIQVSSSLAADGDAVIECRNLAKQLQQYASSICALLPTLLCCNNPSCSNVSAVSELICIGSHKCSRCKSAGYCSRECQKQHWSQHKKICGWILDARSAQAGGCSRCH